ncbi:alpha/beta fold hydrolase [Myxococcus fulvus]|uniref:alpha/beta fold hydrolase n=1 Tax=Myxococcus fulvus TaxID=33 RepID=UPI0020BF08EF|nr:alpha/beta hydrolase [Myxococcus fulvus]MCK8502046.1 alpha/beta hydrolase [Myxococcus fulvus]
MPRLGVSVAVVLGLVLVGSGAWAAGATVPFEGVWRRPDGGLVRVAGEGTAPFLMDFASRRRWRLEPREPGVWALTGSRPEARVTWRSPELVLTGVSAELMVLAPVPVRTEALKVSVEGAELPATLWLPATGVPRNAVVLLHDVGRGSRGALEPYPALLVEHGFAVLTYDARGAGLGAQGRDGRATDDARESVSATGAGTARGDVGLATDAARASASTTGAGTARGDVGLATDATLASASATGAGTARCDVCLATDAARASGLKTQGDDKRTTDAALQPGLKTQGDDKRTTDDALQPGLKRPGDDGRTTEDALQPGLKAQGDDGLAAVRLLRQRLGPSVRVGLMGFGQGAWAAVNASARAPEEVGFLILISGGAGAVWKQEQHRMRNEGRKRGLTGPELVDLNEFLEVLHDARLYEDGGEARARKTLDFHFQRAKRKRWLAVTPLSSLGDVTVERFLERQRPLWREVLSYDAAQDLPRVRGPVLALLGERDETTPAALTARALNQGLSKRTGANDRAQVTVIEGADHALAVVTRELPAVETLSRQALDTLSAWLRALEAQ